MTPEQFDDAVSRTRMKQRSRDMARSILVDAVGPSEAGRMHGASAQAAAQAAERVKAAACPPGWRWVTALLPNRLADKVEKMAEDAR